MIGISYYSKDLTHPADRRRYAYIPRGLHENLSLDRLEEYDVVIVNISTNIPYFLHKFKALDGMLRPKIIFDYCDMTIFDRVHTRILRSVRSIINAGVIMNLICDYEKELLKIADCVICGSVEQRNFLLDYCEKVEIIPDCFYFDFNNVSLCCEHDAYDGITILWEGLASGNYKIFKMISKIEKKLKRKNIKYKFLFITDESFSFLSNFFPVHTFKFLCTLITPCHIKVIKWSPSNLLQAANIEKSVAIIPIPKVNKRMMFKPENKAALWHGLGVKVLCSPTPSYDRYAATVKGVTTCSDIDAFVDEICNIRHSDNRISLSHFNDYYLREHMELWRSIIRKYTPDGDYDKT